MEEYTKPNLLKYIREVMAKKDEEITDDDFVTISCEISMYFEYIDNK